MKSSILKHYTNKLNEELAVSFLLPVQLGAETVTAAAPAVKI